MPIDYRGAVYYLEQIGLVDVFLPFILIFTILFAILQKIALFKVVGKSEKPDKRINGVISFAVALLIVIPHVTGSYPPGQDVIELLNNILPQTIVLIFTIFLVLVLLGLTGATKPAGENAMAGFAALLAILGLGVILWNAFYPYQSPQWLYWLQDPQLQGILVVLLILGIIGYFTMKDEASSGSGLDGLTVNGTRYRKYHVVLTTIRISRIISSFLYHLWRIIRGNGYYKHIQAKQDKRITFINNLFSNSHTTRSRNIPPRNRCSSHDKQHLTRIIPSHSCSVHNTHLSQYHDKTRKHQRQSLIRTGSSFRIIYSCLCHGFSTRPRTHSSMAVLLPRQSNNTSIIVNRRNHLSHTLFCVQGNTQRILYQTSTQSA
jgi:hypothetical protein